MKLVITRQSDSGKQTLGSGVLYGNGGGAVFSFKTLELPWKDNKPQVSCIPKGLYRLALRSSGKLKNHFWIRSVGSGEIAGRSLVLIHSGNYVEQVRGCILVGEKHTDINGDGQRDVVNSRRVLNILLSFAINGMARDEETRAIQSNKIVFEMEIV